MEIFDFFSMNGIENYPAAGEIFLENVILKVSQTLFHGFLPQGRANAPPLGGAVKYPVCNTYIGCFFESICCYTFLISL